MKRAEADNEAQELPQVLPVALAKECTGNTDSPSDQPLLPFAIVLESQAPGADTPIVDVLKRWHELEPGRYVQREQDGVPELRLHFGGHNWFHAPDEPSGDLMSEFAAAFDATAQRRWAIDLHFPANGTSSARVSIAPERSAISSGVEHLGAFVRATVHALSSQVEREPAGPAEFWGVTLTGRPGMRHYKIPRQTEPNEDLRVWARLEPDRFDMGTSHHSTPLYRGRGSNVLAPVTRAVHYLQYVTAPAVFESTALHGWDARLRSCLTPDGHPFYQCVITLPDGRVALGHYPTPGPAAVRAYLKALLLASNDTISIVPQPTDRFVYEVVVAHTDGWCEIPIDKPDKYARVTGSFAVSKGIVEEGRCRGSGDLKVLDRMATAAEVEASVAAGVLPAPWWP